MLGTLLASIFSTSPASRAWTATGSSQTTASMVGAAASALTRVNIGAEFEGMTLIVTLRLLTGEAAPPAGAALVAAGAGPADGVAVHAARSGSALATANPPKVR